MKTLLKIQLVFIVLLITKEASTQEIPWFVHIGSNSWDAGSAVCDKNGNVYIVGGYESNCHFADTTLPLTGKDALFFAKYDANGNEKWVKRFGGNNSGSNADYQAIEVFYDSISDFIFISGFFWGQTQFGSVVLNAVGSDIFLAKYSTNGDCIWVRKFGGDNNQHCDAITVDSSGNIFMVGSSNSDFIFGSIPVTAGGFLAKINSTGTCLWAKHEFGEMYDPYSYSEVGCRGIQVIGSDILLCGCMLVHRIVQIDTMTINHPGFGSSLLCCFNSEGSIKWLKEGISPITSTFSNIVLDSAKNIYHTGSFVDSINFSGTILKSNPLNAEMFLVKYNKNGIFQWVKKADAFEAYGQEVASDKHGNVYVTGNFSGLAGFEGLNITSYTNQDMFLARYSSSGDCYGAIHFANSRGWSISLNDAGNPYITLMFHDTITINSQTIPSYGKDDILLLKCSAITGIKEKQNTGKNKLLIYANPNSGTCNITIPEDLLREDYIELTIYNAEGKMIKHTTIQPSPDKIELNLQAIAKGNYLIVLGKGQKFYSGNIIFK